MLLKLWPKSCLEALVYKASAAALLSLLSVISFADPLPPSPAGYYNQAAFEQAAAHYAPGGGQLLTDNFADARINLPGVFVSSDIDFDGVDKGAGNGHFLPGAYTETTEKYSATVWTFSQPIYALGGDWNLGVVNTGLQIASQAGVYFMPDTTESGFWGFVSPVPIKSVEISVGDQGHPGNFAQAYTFSDLQVVTAVPEPATLGLWISGAALVLLGSRGAGPRFCSLRAEQPDAAQALRNA